MTIPHASLTGVDLHEPKGTSTAGSGQVYVADGLGSGTWTNTSTTSGDFTTGDVKATFKTIADTNWVMMDDGTIGDASSTGTTRANADTEPLFTLLWNNISDTYCAVSTGRGATAAADFAAHKTIALPKTLGRALASAGTGSGLSARALGSTAGEETHLLTTAELPAHNHTATSTSTLTNPTASTSISGGSYSTSVSISDNHRHLTTNATYYAGSTYGTVGSGGAVYVPQGSSNLGGAYTTVTWSGAITATATTSVASNPSASTYLSGGSVSTSTTTANTGSGTAHNVMQPSVFLNYMIKL